MEFWGVELKPAQTLKVEPGENKYLHLSQVSLGEIKDNVKEHILVYVKFNGQKLVLATLAADKCAQVQCDLIFEKEFELSIGSKSTSVYLTGYKTLAVDNDFSDFDESEESDEDIPLQMANGEPVVKASQAKSAAGKPKVLNTDVSAAKAKPKAEERKGGKQKENEDSDSDESDDDDDEESDEDESDDEDMADAGDASEDEDSSDEDDEATVKNAKPSNKRKAEVEDDSEEDEATVKNAKPSKKRKVDSALKTPITEKKSKIGAGEGQKKGGAGKKDDSSGKKNVKAKHPSPKSTGSVTCKSRSKTFNAKAKRGASK